MFKILNIFPQFNKNYTAIKAEITRSLRKVETSKDAAIKGITTNTAEMKKRAEIDLKVLNIYARSCIAKADMDAADAREISRLRA